MNRRRFLKALVAGTASVAISLRLAKEMPKLTDEREEIKRYGVTEVYGPADLREEYLESFCADLVDRFDKELARSLMRVE